MQIKMEKNISRIKFLEMNEGWSCGRRWDFAGEGGKKKGSSGRRDLRQLY